jgi:acetyl-CoA/propionyl-CoA carboxylase biotin carboxyl carrier protein
MGAVSVALARACGYRGVGTVEFVTTADASDFYFLEMNTRLQVEHPVTELIHGIDLVEWQLRIAAGERLGLSQQDLRPRGHAIEARLYAESPSHGFLPSTGTVRRYREPDGVRVDSGVRLGSAVGTDYDPMLAKVIAHGDDRAEAIRLLDRGLAELELLGVETNAAFSCALLARPEVRDGRLDTGLLERVLPDLVAPPPEDLLLAGALVAAGDSRPAGPWRRVFESGTVRIADGKIEYDGRSHTAQVRATPDGRHAVELDGIVRHYFVLVETDVIWVARDGHHLAARTFKPDRSRAELPAGSLESPMPGTILQVRVRDGDPVKAGDVLIVLESMKMELSITAPYAGTIDQLRLEPGDRVELGQPLVAVVEGEQEDS